MKLLLESWKKFNQELLTELKMEQVLPRFESKPFIRAAEKTILDLKQKSPGIYDDVTINTIKDWVSSDVPSDINERYKPEALNWLITNFIRNPEDKMLLSVLKTFLKSVVNKNTTDIKPDPKIANSVKTLTSLKPVSESSNYFKTSDYKYFF